jgi:hypothetical protein
MGPNFFRNDAVKSDLIEEPVSFYSYLFQSTELNHKLTFTPLNKLLFLLTCNDMLFCCAQGMLCSNVNFRPSHGTVLLEDK